MPRLILLPVRGNAADEPVFAMALAIGRLFDSHLVMLHTRPDVRTDIATLAAGDGGLGAGIDTIITEMDTEADAHEHAAEASWRAFCERNGIAIANKAAEKGMTSEWMTEIGVESDWLAAHGRTADLIVVGRGDDPAHPDLVAMEAALMDTGKPVVIAPPAAVGAAPLTLNGVTGIAWNDTREAATAVAAAMPLLSVSGSVVIFTVSDDEDGTDKSHLRLARMLRWHNPNVTIQILKPDSRPPVEVLLDAASKAGCGLLVMGGYGNAQLWQALFGGFTRSVLEQAPLPVLMAH